MKRKLCTGLIVLALVMVTTGTARAQSPITDEVIVSLLDESEQPVADAAVTLVLMEYGDLGVSTVTVGSCTTDAAGQCSILAIDPPHLDSGWTEGYLDLGDLGIHFLGWYVGVGLVEVPLRLLGGGMLATVAAPLDAPYDEQTQQPTDGPANLPTATLTRTPRPTFTSTPEPTETQQPTATDAPTSTETSAPTVAVVVAGSDDHPSTSVPLLLVVIVGATAVACVALFSLVVVFMRSRKHQKEQQQNLGAVSSLTVAVATVNGGGTSLDVVNNPEPETGPDNDKPQQERT